MPVKTAELATPAKQLARSSFSALWELIDPNDRPALRFSDGRSQFISHRNLHDFVRGFRLPSEVTSSPKRPVVCVALPNGPLLAAVCLAVATYYVAAPINPAVGPDQFRADISRVGAAFILTTASDVEALQLEHAWVRDGDIRVLVAELEQDMAITVREVGGNRPLNLGRGPQPRPNKTDDVSIVLFTSGTTGTKKVVPLRMNSLLAGAAEDISSWALTDRDTSLNMMPLYNIGGLVRNIFAPILSGGSVVCFPFFDAGHFWDVVGEDRVGPTWYYASPSMHSVILDEALRRPGVMPKSRMRLVCSASGDLPHALAAQLRHVFRCPVLPSYGMTECMPISTPPIDYCLDRPGTSGLPTGPEVAISSTEGAPLPTRSVGHICVRGGPLFQGYLRPDGTLDKSCFRDGWFDTGDLGYLDPDGYLFITGRSKEVINRGGELISPFEVENSIMVAARDPASPIHGRVSQVLAFAVPHSVLQEVVGVVLVTPEGERRVDIRHLNHALQSSLQQVKWPTLITYMGGLPKRNNKFVRTRLAQRLGLPELSDRTAYFDKHWEAACPAPDTDLAVPIPASVCVVDTDIVRNAIYRTLPRGITAHVRKDARQDQLEAFLAPQKTGQDVPHPKLTDSILEELQTSLDDYLCPRKIHCMEQPLQVTADGSVDDGALQAAVDRMAALRSSLTLPASSTTGRVTKIFVDVLSCSPSDIDPEAHFFSLGGDSLRAGRLLSALRSEFRVQLPINVIFGQGSALALADYIDTHIPATDSESHSNNSASRLQDLPGCAESCSSTNPVLMVLQLFPLVLFYPMRRALIATLFLYTVAFTRTWGITNTLAGFLLVFVASVGFALTATAAVVPLFGIVAKWIIIGRHRAGLYPMWGVYHTRWWLTQKIVHVCGPGLFGMSNATLCIYYRLLGATIGSGVQLPDAVLGEWDLLEIQSGATLEKNSICRAFAGERNTSMYLAPIVIGRNASVGLASVVAPGSHIPPDTCIGPKSSSWELDDATEANRDLLPSRVPEPHWILYVLATLPVVGVVHFVGLLPWLFALVGLVMEKPPRDPSITRVLAILNWFTAGPRIKWHYIAIMAKVLLGPIFFFGFVVLFKKLLDLLLGTLRPSPAKGRGQMDKWRITIMREVMPTETFLSFIDLFGQHYEATSVAIRALGGTVGKRIYWPIGGIEVLGDYHLVSVGDDVVFGSDSYLVTSDCIGAERITIEDKANISDRVMLLPGSTIGAGAVMGSGALGQRGKYYSEQGKFVGSKHGDSVCLVGDVSDAKPAEKGGRKSEAASPTSATGTESTPFGRAFYLGLAPYHVLGQFAVTCYSSFVAALVAAYWDTSALLAIQVADRVVRQQGWLQGDGGWRDPLLLYAVLAAFNAAFVTIQTILATSIVIAAKWILLGRLQVGNYDWDKSSYCQRWQMFFAADRLQKRAFRRYGIVGMLSGTWYCAQYFRLLGATIGKDCAIFAGGRPSTNITEPDLLTMGDRVVVDDASLVCHVNTEGTFDLNPLHVEDRCVMRTGSRLLSGATMLDDACLLEHTLVMGGDVVGRGETMQGWPGDVFQGRRVADW
ncbi:hypothetical protein B0I37DRAFT_435284 [Chaetomium sp. MPI-CAGE-AT-0009]|nr:hypothetical protein B0I37DRAFT_435284 [Chaetomium sp. MPI-CAGE-AT-0009]